MMNKVIKERINVQRNEWMNQSQFPIPNPESLSIGKSYFFKLHWHIPYLLLLTLSSNHGMKSGKQTLLLFSLLFSWETGVVFLDPSALHHNKWPVFLSRNALLRPTREHSHIPLQKHTPSVQKSFIQRTNMESILHCSLLHIPFRNYILASIT